MIGYLKGTVLSKNQEQRLCTLGVQETGYEVSVPKGLFEQLLMGQSIELWVHTVVREDALLLFGFPAEVEKHFFRLLLSVSGLGPKTALSLISEHGVAHLCQLLLQKKSGEIASAPGVGKKLADRLVVELLPKIEKWAWFERIELPSSSTAVRKAPFTKVREDLTSALTYLGYPAAVVRPILDKLGSERDLEKEDFENSLKLALREISGGVTRSREMGATLGN